jgi:nucleotide-binding universal stress UspA family protein
MGQFFHKNLCPIAFDEQCVAALDLARTLAEQTGGRVHALHVVAVDADADTSWEKGATIQLEKIVNERLAGKVDYEFVVRTGSAADEVLKAARDFGSDLIVIPTQGRVGLKRLVLGSVAECVIRESTFLC